MVWVLLLLVLLVSAFLFYASYCIGSGVYVKAFCGVKTTEKVVALTFDDGPDDNTPKVLDILRKHQVKATFFCIGSRAENKTELLKRIEAEGHLIGNHTYSHKPQLPIWSSDKISADIANCEQILSAVLNHEIKYFRPPFGVTNPLIKKALSKFHYKVIGWNVRSYDTNGAPAEKVISRIERHLQPGSVILLHDRLPQSAEILTLLFDLLYRKDYKVVGLEELMEKENVTK